MSSQPLSHPLLYASANASQSSPSWFSQSTCRQSMVRITSVSGSTSPVSSWSVTVQPVPSSRPAPPSSSLGERPALSISSYPSWPSMSITSGTSTRSPAGSSVVPNPLASSVVVPPPVSVVSSSAHPAAASASALSPTASTPPSPRTLRSISAPAH